MKKKNLVWTVSILLLLVILFIRFLSINDLDWSRLSDLSQHFIMYYYIYILLLHLGLIVLFIVLNFKKIVVQFSTIKNKTWIFLILIFIFAIVLRFTLSPMADSYQSAGGEYMLSAKSILVHHRYIGCDEGGFYNCKQEITPPHPGGYPVLLSFFYMTFGASLQTTLIFNILFGALTTTVVFLLFYLLFRDEIGALFAALILAILKSHIVFSGTAEATVLNLFFITLTFFLLILSLKIKSYKIYTLFLLLLFYSVHIKTENLLIFPFIAVFLYLFREEPKELNSRKLLRIQKKESPFFKISILILLFLLFSVSFFIIYQSNNPAFRSDDKETMLSLGLFNRDKHLFLNELGRFTIPFILLLGCGFIFWKTHKNKILFLIIWALSFGLFYTSYYVDDIQRYILTAYSSFAILIGLGISNILNFVKKKKLVSTKLVIALLFIIFIVYLIKVKPVSDGMISEIGSAVEALPKSSYILVANWNDKQVAQFLSSKDQTILSADYIRKLNPSQLEQLIQGKRKIFFLKSTGRCFTSQSKDCEYFEELFNLKEIDLISSKKYDLNSLTIYEIEGLK